MRRRAAPDTPPAATPGLPRRLAAAFYDALLLLAVFFMLTLAAVILKGGPVRWWESTGPELLLPLSLLLAWAGFFLWFWSHGGQTLGMRAWRLRLVTDAGSPVGPGRALIRLGAAVLSALPLGLGYLWILLDRDRLAWHDRLSRTRMVLLAKPGAGPGRVNAPGG